MKCLITGSTGFLGKIIITVLPDLKFIRVGKNNCNIIADISKDILFLPKCDLIIHAAGKAHMLPKTSEGRQSFFNVNVNGTRNLLHGLEEAPDLPKAFVFISSVAVYGKESGILINENENLSAKDPYGQSKIQAEELITKWCAKNNVICTILRLPLIAGPNPPGNLGAMIKGIRSGYYFNIGGCIARKSIVLAEDVAAIIPKAAEVGGIYNLTDGYHPNFPELSELIAKQLNKNKPGNIPTWLVRVIAKTGDLLGSKAPINSNKLRKITSNLTFDDSKARKLLGWSPTPVLEGFKIQ